MNLKQSCRIIFRNRTYSVLNIAGLAVGIASAALILMWVEYQYNFNKNIPNHKNLYRIGQHQRYGDDVRTFFVSPGPLFETLNSEFPEVKCNTRYTGGQMGFLKENDILPVDMHGAFVDSCLFGMLSLQFVAGNPSRVFEPAQPIVISERMAATLFGNHPPLGETLKDNEGVSYEVTGIFKNVRKGNSFQFDWLIPFHILEKSFIKKGYISDGTHWGANWHTSYAELHPDTDLPALNARLARLAADKTDGAIQNAYFMYPIDRLSLYGEFSDGIETGGGYIGTVRLFFWIGCIILLIACINFMNLSTARSEKRTLEVGVRKTFGSHRRQLVQQFMGEAGIITCVALVLAVGLISACLPAFNTLIAGNLSFRFTDPWHYAGLLTIGLVCTLLAGSYPAFYLSSFAPLTVLKKLRKPGGAAAWIRQGLVVLQFSVSFILICATLVIYLQISHGQSRPLGFVKENVLIFPANSDIALHAETVRSELLGTGLIEHAGFSSSTLTRIWNNGSGYQWQGKAPDVNPLISHLFVSPGFLEAAGVTLAEGSFFTRPTDEDAVPQAIVNRTLANMMGEEGRVGAFIGQGSMYHSEIVGIIDDFVFNNVYGLKPEPLLIRNYSRLVECLFVKPRAGADLLEVQARVKQVLQGISPNTSFDVLFMDDAVNQLFANERFTGRLAGLFAALAIFISCLGLFGLSAFAAERRTREIGIRKVLGASTGGILVLLGKNFMLLIAIAMAVGLPVAWYVSRQWLQSYDYRITLGWYIFAGTMALIAFIALFTVSLQALRAATANPIRAIKTE
jgi:ABC-type lipoprotein release transport system permease subunit